MENTSREQILQYMLRQIDNQDGSIVQKTVENFNISKSTAYNYLKTMCEDGMIKKSNNSATGYQLATKEYKFQYKNDGTLDEARVFDRDISKFFVSFEKNVFSAWRYAFTEMMNNAIEHSEAPAISVVVLQNALKTAVRICDNGIGIFKNIQRYMKNEKNEDLALDECVALLFAGKFTTARHLHSGEGIFFTSHLMDTFIILSYGVCFTRNIFRDAQISGLSQATGTGVYMELDNHSKKTTTQVFDRFSDVEAGFIRTQIPIAYVFPNGSPVSRSEARRLGELLLRFKEVELDFTGVEEVGQAFVHELFIVWQGHHPEIRFTLSNTNNIVENMIKRVMNTK